MSNEIKNDIFKYTMVVLNLILLSIVGYFLWFIMNGQKYQPDGFWGSIQSSYAQIIEMVANYTNHTMGDDSAPVTIVGFGDFQCPYCKRFHDNTLDKLKEEYIDTGGVRSVYIHLAFLGQESIWAAEASECASEQGKFWEYQDKLFSEQDGENRGGFKKDNLKRFASDLGLDSQIFNACLDDGKYSDYVSSQIELASQLGVQSTP